MDKPIGPGVVKLVQDGELYIIELAKIFTYLNKTMVYRTSDSQRIYITALFWVFWAYRSMSVCELCECSDLQGTNLLPANRAKVQIAH